MGRVSLTESYDDRSVIAKLNEMDKRVTENTTVVTSAEASAKASAQAAQETADRFAGSVGAVVQNANQQINASKAQVDQAKAEVDETVTTVAQAVQTANNASASAQQSAETVAGYEGRVTALETADGQDVKLTGNQNITGIKTVPTEATGIRSQQIANSEKVGAELDNYESMVRTTGNQTIAGIKSFSSVMLGDNVIFEGGTVSGISSTTRTNYHNVLEITPSLRNHYRIAILGGLNNNSIVSAEIEIVFGTNTVVNYVLIHNKSTNAGRAIKIKITRSTGNKIRLWVLEGQYVVYRAYVMRVTDAGTIKYSDTFAVPGTILSDPTTESDYQDTVTALNYVDYPIE